jgi:hypothetical protein
MSEARFQFNIRSLTRCRSCLVVLMALLVHDVGFSAESEASVRFLAERTPVELGDVILAAGDREAPPFVLRADRLTAPIKAPGRTMALRLPGHVVTLATISLPQEGDFFVVLLIPNPKGGYLPVVMRADDPAFRAGDIYLFNNSGKPVLGYVGTSRFLLKPGEGKPLRPAGERDATFYDVGFAVREGNGTPGKEGLATAGGTDSGVHAEVGDRVLRTVRWPVVKRSRSYVFFYLNPVKNRIDYRAVDEFIAPPESPQQP